MKTVPIDPQPEPIQLRALKGEIGKCWPMTSLLDVLKVNKNHRLSPCPLEFTRIEGG